MATLPVKNNVFNIFIYVSTETIFSMKVRSAEPVSIISQFVLHSLGRQFHYGTRLAHKGQYLSDETKAIGDYGISNGSILIFICGQRGS